MENQVQKIKPRILCLHGHGSNAMKLENQVKEKWPEFVLEKLDLLFLDAPFLIDVEGSDPPHFEWFHADQGAIVSASMPGIQSHGAALTKVPKIKHVVVISGGKFGGKMFGMPALAADAFSSPVVLPSLHIIGGKTDQAEPKAIALLDSFVDPIVIYHDQGHTIPKLDGKDLGTMLDFIDKISKLP